MEHAIRPERPGQADGRDVPAGPQVERDRVTAPVQQRHGHLPVGAALEAGGIGGQGVCDHLTSALADPIGVGVGENSEHGAAADRVFGRHTFNIGALVPRRRAADQ